MQIDVFTIFPEMLESFISFGLLGKAQKQDLLDIRIHNIRDFGLGTHQSVDDTPYGGGAGMVFKPEPIFQSIEKNNPQKPLIALTPTGNQFNQAKARELSQSSGFSLLCGRYEGIDERVYERLVDEEISLGDYVLNGGEVGAMVILEAVGRLVPSVMGNARSHQEESFSSGLLEYPQYTKPAEFRGMVVPPILLSGNHGRIAKWRMKQSLLRTLQRRPDLIALRGGISDEEQLLLNLSDEDI